jgi:hypothetical protein
MDQISLANTCDARPDKRPEGMSEWQHRKIKDRKQFARHLTDEAKWRLIYQILFPGDIPIPSPCEQEHNRCFNVY